MGWQQCEHTTVYPHRPMERTLRDQVLSNTNPSEFITDTAPCLLTDNPRTISRLRPKKTHFPPPVTFYSTGRKIKTQCPFDRKGVLLHVKVLGNGTFCTENPHALEHVREKTWTESESFSFQYLWLHTDYWRHFNAKIFFTILYL